jgi:hypothetical protein
MGNFVTDDDADWVARLWQRAGAGSPEVDRRPPLADHPPLARRQLTSCGQSTPAKAPRLSNSSVRPVGKSGTGRMHRIATDSAPTGMASSSTNRCGSNSDQLPATPNRSNP